MVQIQLKTKHRRILLKLNSKEWSEPLAIFMLYYAVLAVRETELAAYNISTSTFCKHVEVTSCKYLHRCIGG